MSRPKRQPDTRPLAGLRVLNTRAREDAAELHRRLEGLGAQVFDLSTISIEPLMDSDSMRAALEHLDRYDWIAFTSRNAVRAVFPSLDWRNWNPGSAPKVAAIGPSTAAEIQRRGMGVSLMPGEATSEALARAMITAGVRDSRIFLPVGNLARDELRRALEQAGARVECVVAYRTVPAQNGDDEALKALLQKGIDVVALASPSAFLALTDMRVEGLFDALRLARLVCIGPTTAASVREAGFEPAGVADLHTIDGLVDEVVEVCGRETS